MRSSASARSLACLAFGAFGAFGTFCVACSSSEEPLESGVVTQCAPFDAGPPGPLAQCYFEDACAMGDCGDRMPQANLALDPVDLATIVAWVREGAPR